MRHYFHFSFLATAFFCREAPRDVTELKKLQQKKGEDRERTGTGRQNKAGLQQCTEDMWVCISMLAAARRHRLSLMKYFCSQSSDRGSSPSTSLALIPLSSSNSTRPSGLSSSKSLSLLHSPVSVCAAAFFTSF